MSAPGWPITLLLIHLFSSATSSPVSIYTPSPPLASQISPPSSLPANLPAPLSPSPSILSPIPPLISNSGESAERIRCPMMMSPSSLVVRFGDPVQANCSIAKTGFSLLGWEVPLTEPNPTMDSFLVWSVDRMTEWSIRPVCYALSDQGGVCHINLPLIVYQPPGSVSIRFVNNTGPMLEGHEYTLECTVQDVAPVENLVVTFYREQTALGQLRSNNTTEKTPVTEIFTLDIIHDKEDDGAQYWCEAKLELGSEGPQHPPVVTSQKLSTTVVFGLQVVCPTKLQVREGESVECEVTGNPQPLVTWFRDGQMVALPSHSRRQHTGKYIICARGFLGQKHFTVEVEVLPARGTASSCNGHFLLAALLTQMINWL
ncbi:hemicentin-1-like [Brachyistius frenatus]|uniref:hemicentin-1-like n=1 Tax=Brachyistius frenatus TaxID=100188 RepID=UPI0037E75556